MAKATLAKKISRYICSGLIVALAVGFIITGCTAAQNEGFAIYLTRDNVSPAKMEALSNVELAGQPVISMNDIVAYYGQTHVLKLTSAAYECISNLEVPTTGKSFVVCVNKKPLYWGAFWASFSSQSFNGVNICKPFISMEPGLISFDLGYPASSFYSGEDPRNHPDVLKSLEQAGKLIKELNLSTIHRLPSPAKGYELYSWLQEEQWHFTLITGTNRIKTLDEIVSTENILSETGLVKISVIGVEAIKDVLSKIPIGTWVSWWNELPNSSEPTNIKIQLPPIEIRDAIRDFALQSQLDFHISEP